MSCSIKYKGEIIYELDGNYKSVPGILTLVPKDIRKRMADIVDYEYEHYKKKFPDMFELENSDIIIREHKVKDVKLVNQSSRVERNKKYYDKIKKEKIECECGSIVLKVAYKRHLQSKKHKERCGYRSCEDE